MEEQIAFYIYDSEGNKIIPPKNYIGVVGEEGLIHWSKIETENFMVFGAQDNVKFLNANFLS